ncbi:MAG: DUF6504 family protein [Coriobacteriales bacterium]|nr:DUF6504 family protein [Actinomycetes bacterium]
MGRNRAIKEFDPARQKGQPLDLFTGRESRLPVVLELLKSPWIVRGSQVAKSSTASAGKRREEAVEVVWDGRKASPVEFVWHDRRYRVDALVQTWTVERSWWDLRRHQSRRCFRVLARGGLYDLAYDRLADVWLLTGIVD